MKNKLIQTAYGQKARVQISFADSPGKTKQSFKEECNINNILAKYQKTGVIDHINKNEPYYQDNTGESYLESMQIVSDAQKMFNELPSSVRKKFENNPALFLDFVNDENNLDELRTMGLATPKPIPAKTIPAPPATSGDSVAEASGTPVPTATTEKA